jgi:flagellar basal-body rod protein FlgF/flagellar basal-body rod protein FlgG
VENAFLVGLSRQAASRRELDVIANNIANLNTSGFKADATVFEEFMMPQARGAQFGNTDRRVSFVADRATWHDMRQGSVQQTGNPLDVAIDGKGFLAVETPRGERYTRNGALQVNAAGELVTSEGHRVMGDAGPIVLQTGDRDITFARDGSVSVAQGARGRLRLVEFAEPGRLKKDAATTFTAPDGVQPQAATASSLVQSSVEKSNVTGVVEMTRLIEVTRAYSNVAQMMEKHGDLRRTAIERLAEVPS